MKKLLSMKLFLLLIIVLIISTIGILNSKLLNKLDKTIFSNNVQLIITPEYDEFFAKEDIWINFKLVNYSDNDYYLKHPFEISGISFIVTNPSKRKRDIGFENNFIRNDSSILKPKESYEKLIPLNMIKSDIYSDENIEYGTYQMYTNYQNIISNEIIFKISEPEGIDKQLYDLTYNDLFRTDISLNDKLVKLEDLLEKFPTSRYIPQLYNILLVYTITSTDDQRFLNNVNKFFQYNNNSYGSKFILNSYSIYLSGHLKLDSMQINSKINELIMKYPNSKIEKVINLNLEENKFKK